MRWWHLVNRNTIRADIIAGLTGAAIVLPQGVAFATIAGLPPEYGLYAAMVPTIIAALFGSSWHLVSGPTTAISIVIFASLSTVAEPGSPYYISLVLTLTFLTGVFQLAMGLARMGALVNFISHTVVLGFTAGAAILIAVSQIKNFVGLEIPRGASVYQTLSALFSHVLSLNPYVLTVGVASVLAGLIIRRYWPKFPYMIAAMVAGSLVAIALNRLFGPQVAHIPVIGALPQSLPPLSMPDFSKEALQLTASSALAVTMLALTEAVSIARAVAIKSEQYVDSNQEFIGQGLANIFGGFTSGYASSGSFNRSGLNYSAGARTPLAAVFAAFFLVLILFLVAPLAAYLPLAAMAGVLFLVAWSLIDFRHIKSIIRTSPAETGVLFTTLLATLFVELEFAIYIGVMLSLMLYLNRTSRPVIKSVVPEPSEGSYHYVSADQFPECCQLKMLRINGSIFFGAVNHVRQALTAVDADNPQKKHVLIVASSINFIDIAGAEMLAQEARRRAALSGGLYFYRVKESACKLLKKGDYLSRIGEQNIFPAKANVIGAIYPKLDSTVCYNCKTRIFKQCHIALPNGEPRTN